MQRKIPIFFYVLKKANKKYVIYIQIYIQNTLEQKKAYRN